MTMLTRLEIYGVIALLIGGVIVGNYIYVKHLQTKIAGLEEKVSGLELQKEIVEKAAKVVDEYNKKKTTVQRKATSEKTEIDQTVQAGDNVHLRELFVNHGLLQPKSNPSPSRAPGRP